MHSVRHLDSHNKIDEGIMRIFVMPKYYLFGQQFDGRKDAVTDALAIDDEVPDISSAHLDCPCP